MQSRIFPAIYNLLKQGEELNKYTAAKKVHCDQRSAQRILTHFHVVGDTRICGWIRSKGSPIPAYVLNDGKMDERKPKPLSRSPAELNPIRRAKKRLSNPPAIGIWGI